MKIDVNVKLYHNPEKLEVFTEEEIKAKISDMVESEMEDFKSGDYYDFEGLFHDYCNSVNQSKVKLVDAIYNAESRKTLEEDFRQYLIDTFTETVYDECIKIEKTVQVEI